MNLTEEQRRHLNDLVVESFAGFHIGADYLSKQSIQRLGAELKHLAREGYALAQYESCYSIALEVLCRRGK